MKLLIDIPKEFEQHFQTDGFEDSLHRLSADAHLLAGNYEQETAAMLIEAFASAVTVPPHGRLIDADALGDAFTNLRWTTGDYKTGELAHWGDRKDWCLKGQEVDELIQSAPTIIEGESGEGWVF